MKRAFTFFLLLMMITVCTLSCAEKNSEERFELNDFSDEQSVTNTGDDEEADDSSEMDLDQLDASKPKKITITGSKYVAKGKKITLKATVAPEKANQKVTWTSSDKKIATVSAKGVVKGIKPGKVKITATSVKNKKIKKTITIEVKAKAVKNVKITGNTDLDLAGIKTVTLKAKATPAKAAQSFEWTSSDPGIATVSEKGKVTAKSAGTVRITATATDGSKKKSTVTITVRDSAAVEHLAPATPEEAAAVLVNLINTYDGTIQSVPGYEAYDLARLIVRIDGELPDISAYSPAVIIKDPYGLHIIQFTDPVMAKNCSDFLNAQPGIQYAEPDRIYTCDAFSTRASSRKDLPYSWGITETGLDAYAQRLLARGIKGNVKVAVLDSGVTPTHALFSGRTVLTGYDYVDNDQDPRDDFGHGTHVAGTILDGTPGMNVSIIPVRIAKKDEIKDKSVATSMQFFYGMKFAIGAGANIINISMGGSDSDPVLIGAVNAAIQAGITVVVSAGNENADVSNHCPANIKTPGCITVSAINGYFTKNIKSNYGNNVDLCAPGEGIKGAGLGGETVSNTGTSMAAPHVAAAAALLLCENPGLSPATIESRLKNSARDLGDPGYDIYYGAGMVDLTPFRINEINFPDDNFRKYIIDAGFDADHDGMLSEEERKKATRIECPEMSISSLKGIEYFTSAESLDCHKNNLTSLDLGSNTALTYLNCNDNKLSSLDVRKNTALKRLYCYRNLLTSLSFTNNPMLEEICCQENQISSLDVTMNTALATLLCDKNQIGSLDLSNNTALVWLDCSANQLTNLDLNNHPALKSIKCTGNQLANLGFGNSTALQELYCNNNELTSLDLSHNTALQTMLCQENKLTKLDVSHNTGLAQLWCYSNQFTNLDVSNCPELCNLVQHSARQTWDEYFRWNIVPASNAPVLEVDKTVTVKAGDKVVPPDGSIAIDADSFPDEHFRQYIIDAGFDTDSNGWLSEEELKNVTRVYCPERSIASLKGIEYFPSLTYLYCFTNNLTSLDVSMHTALKELACHQNQLTSLNVTKNVALELLYCGDNPIGTLDITKNTALKDLYCGSNSLKELDVGQNKALIKLDCVKNQISSLDLQNNTALTEVECSWNQLSELDLTKNTALTYIRCRCNQLTSLKLGYNTVLKNINCYDNQLKSLDISNNFALEVLSCASNQLEELNVSWNTKLKILGCFSNKIKNLDVTNCTALFDLVQNSDRKTDEIDYDYWQTSSESGAPLLRVDKEIPVKIGMITK